MGTIIRKFQHGNSEIQLTRFNFPVSGQYYAIVKHNLEEEDVEVAAGLDLDWASEIFNLLRQKYENSDILSP